jgi:hypothetical protein
MIAARVKLEVKDGWATSTMRLLRKDDNGTVTISKFRFQTTRLTIAINHEKRVNGTYERTGTSLINLLAFNELATEVAGKYENGQSGLR